MIINTTNTIETLKKNNYKNPIKLQNNTFYCDDVGQNILNVDIVSSSNNRGKLIFRYGAMGSSKTANLLMCAFNYEERGQKVLVIKSGVDTRDGALTIKSRIGLSKECTTIETFMTYPIEDLCSYTAILCDEVQFATKEQIDYLGKISDLLGITIICFGLRTDFKGNFFPGSHRLMEIADEIAEIKTICWCGKKATFNARYNENGIIRNGEQVELGANDSYISVCRHHFSTGELFGPNN